MIIPVLIAGLAVVVCSVALFRVFFAGFSKPLNNPAHEPRQPKQHKRKNQRSTELEQ